MRAITSATSSSSSIARAAIFVEYGLTGWGPTRPASRSCAPTSRGKPKWAAWSPWRWPISRPPTVKANSPRRPGPAATPGHDVTSRVMRSLARSMPAKLQAQVSLKSSARAHDDRRGGPAQRRGDLRAALLRGPRTDRLRSLGLGPPPLPAAGPAPHRVHRLRPAGRSHPRRDRRRARQAPARPCADAPRLEPAHEDLERAHRRPDRRAATPTARVDGVHRVRLPLARSLPPGEPRGPRRRPGPRPAVLDRRPPGRVTAAP